MADNESASKNPILEWLKKFRPIPWVLAFLVLFGGALKWSNDVYDVIVKFTSKTSEEIQKKNQKKAEEQNQEMKLNAIIIGYAAAWLASGDAYFAQAVAKGVQVTKAELDKENAEVRRNLAEKLVQFHIAPGFADLDFSEPQYGQTSDATAAVASAIRAKNGEEAKKYFLFGYYVYRLLSEFMTGGDLSIKEPKRSALLLRMNENIPSGVEPFQPISGTFREFCNYWVANSPMTGSAPAFGKLDEVLLRCQTLGRGR